jgi:hypothetical protein
MPGGMRFERRTREKTPLELRDFIYAHNLDGIYFPSYYSTGV